MDRLPGSTLLSRAWTDSRRRGAVRANRLGRQPDAVLRQRVQRRAAAGGMQVDRTRRPTWTTSSRSPISAAPRMLATGDLRRSRQLAISMMKVSQNQYAELLLKAAWRAGRGARGARTAWGSPATATSWRTAPDSPATTTSPTRRSCGCCSCSRRRPADAAAFVADAAGGRARRHARAAPRGDGGRRARFARRAARSTTSARFPATSKTRTATRWCSR